MDINAGINVSLIEAHNDPYIMSVTIYPTFLA